MSAWPFNSALALYIFKRLKSSRRRQPDALEDWSESWEPLLEKAGLLSAEARAEARDAAAALEKAGRLLRQMKKGKLHRVLVPRASERDWFADANERHPAERQSGLATATREAAKWGDTAPEWDAWCERLAVEMEAGRFPDFVDRHEDEAAWLRDLEVVNQLTGHPWSAGTLLRVASAEAVPSKFHT